MSYCLHAHAGAKVADPPELPSPASTVPGNDEAAAEMARLSYQASKMQTPEDMIRKAPATPQNPPLSRMIQSVELLSAPTLDLQSSGAPMPEPSESGQPKTSAKLATAKGTVTRKKTKKSQKSAKSKHHPSKKNKVVPKSKAPAPTQTEHTQPGKVSEKTPDVSPNTCHAAASACLPLPPPGISPVTDQTGSAIPSKTAQTEAAQPDQTGFAVFEAEAAELDQIGSAVPSKTAQREAAQPDQTGSAVKEETPEPAMSPQPESVRQMLNRAQTTESMDLMAITEAVRDTVKAALPHLTSPESSPRTDELPKKVIGRSKETHARRMRFYRSLESFLHQVGLVWQQPSAEEIGRMNCFPIMHG